jgi:hypothetical protein
MRRDLHAIPAQLHAAPIPRVILGCIVKVENAGGIPALFDQRKVSPTE